jgi:hypothetical protein
MYTKRYCIFVFLSTIACGTLAATENDVCVTTPSEFQSALTAAETASVPTVIQVTAGTYAIDSTLTYHQATSSQPLTIQGGFGELFGRPCSLRIANPALTILDGGKNTAIIHLDGLPGWSVTIDSLTLQNGLSNASAVGAALVVEPLSADINVDIENNVFTANSNSSSSSILEITVRGSVSFLNNAFVANSLENGYGINIDSSSSSDSVVFNNNTVTGNSCGSSSPQNALSLLTSSSTDVQNNILLGNAECLQDAVFSGLGAFDLGFNDFGVVSQTVTTDGGSYNAHDNLSMVPPQFVGSGSYELTASSSLVDAGTNTAAGGVGTVDVAGKTRIVGIRSATATIDIGAYELQDDIFKNGFE